MWSCHAALRGPPLAGCGSSTVSTRKLARPRAVNSAADRARARSPSATRRVPVGAPDAPLGVVRVDQRVGRVWQGEHERVLGAQHAVDLPEDAVDVVHGRQTPHRQHGVDRVGPDEGQLGERCVVQLDPDLLALAGRACLGHLVRRLVDADHLGALAGQGDRRCGRRRTRGRGSRLPSTLPRSRSVSSRGTSGP